MGKLSAWAIFALAAGGVTAISCDRGATPTERPGLDRQSLESCSNEPAAKVGAVLRYLHLSNEFEMRLGNLAANRTGMSEIRQFATQMVSEHASADQKLVDLARNDQIDLSAIPSLDPIHAALERVLADEEGRLQTVSGVMFDAAYLGPQSEQHEIALQAIEEAQSVATRDTKSFLDGEHEMASQHRDRALSIMQDLRFRPRAIGGGPPSTDESNVTSALPGPREKQRSAAPRPMPGDPGAASTGKDAGIWPPLTTPPEEIP
jgi:predicted outer membrane protein